MRRTPLSLDTSRAIEEAQIEGWRRMTLEQKAAVVSSLTRAVIDLAKAGIRERHPDASPEEQRLRLAVVLHGRDLALKAFPEIAALTPP